MSASSELVAAARQALQRGDAAAAMQLATQRLSADPADIDALEVRSIVETQRRDFAAAEATLRAAIAAAPARRWHYADLARLLIVTDRAAEAEAVARAALAADADNADAHAMLGTLLVDRAMPVPGAVHLGRAVALAGRHPQLLGALGRALLRQGRLAEARPLLEEAVAADHEALLPLVHLAELEEQAGRFDDARRLLDRAERIAGREGRDVVLQRASLLARSGSWQEALALLDRQSQLSGAALLQRGRLRDRAGRHAEAWNDWTRGKAVLAAATGRHYAAADVARQAEALAAFFDARRLATLPKASPRTDVAQPIFIIGFPRSGTTLVEQILASHSGIRAGGELPFGRDVRDFAVALVGGEAHFPQGIAAMTAADQSHWPVLLRDLYLAKAERYGLTAPGAAYFTDKMPLNDMWLPLLRLAFPEAPIVWVRRHPLDVLTSVMAHDMTHGFNCGYRIEDAARHLTLIDGLMARYRLSGVGITHELRYETLVADQRGETERLMAAIGLEMEPTQLRFHERDMVSPTPSYAQVREPLNDRSIGRWRHHQGSLAAIMPLLAPVLERGGFAV
ncbi:MAG: tetratricopeptide repeat-containing sulfotransferase family protein [Sphingomonas sp.]